MIPWHRALPAVFLVLAMTACSGGQTGAPGSAAAPEANVAGDIPDNQAFVPFTATSGLFTVSVPEGWTRAADGDAVVFSDKLNSVRIEQHAASTAPTVDSVRADELPGIRSSATGFQEGKVEATTRKAGPGVLVTYSAESAANQVTGKTVVQDVERYDFFRNGQEVVLTLAAAQGSDNVDPWRTVTDSLSWSQ
jgi:hypothetical protein